MPAEDRERSPFTGWTRAHWERIADLLLDGVRPYASRRQALLFVPDSRQNRIRRPSDGLQGFARTFLLAAFRLAGSRGTAPGNLAERYAAGLRAGTNRSSPEAWPRLRHTSQQIVEAAFIALALYESRPWTWDSLSGPEQARVIAWLAEIHDKRVWPNNWLLFPVIINAFLKSVSGPYSAGEVSRNLDIVDSWYRGDGWYTDGTGENYDYYVGWAIHFFTLIWCRLDGDRSDPSRAAVYRQRAREYLQQFSFFFAANGAPLYHGRSLTYRLATIAPLWAGSLLDATPLAPGETRRIASGVLRHFIERGALCNAVLTRGWYREFLPMLQPYSGFGSQYWASQAFLGLLLPPEHPVWTSREELMPVERGDFTVAMPVPGFLLRGTRCDGIVRVASHRSDHYPLHLSPRAYLRRALERFLQAAGLGKLRPLLAADDPHYRKLAYSTHAAPEICDPADADIDSQIALLRRGGIRSRRVRIYPLTVVDRFAASCFYPREPYRAECVETVSIARGSAEIRVHHITSNACEFVRDGGFTIADDAPPETSTGAVWAAARLKNGLTSLIASLHGFGTAATRALTGTNPFGPHSATPYLTARRPASPETVYVSLVVLSGSRIDANEILAEIRTVQVSGRRVLITCRDGELFFVQLVAPEPVDFYLGPVHLQGRVRLARIAPDGPSFILRE